MALRGDLFIFIGSYSTIEQAEADYEIVREKHGMDAVGTYDAAIVTKDDEGKVHVSKVEMAARHAGWGGAVAGALVGLLFPPAIMGTALVGAAIGVASGHLWRGISRSGVKELGEIIDAGEVALVVVGTNRLEQTLDTRSFRAKKHVLKNVEVNGDELDEALRETVTEVRETSNAGSAPAPDRCSYGLSRANCERGSAANTSRAT
jgi:uncharacterized membrane protein